MLTYKMISKLKLRLEAILNCLNVNDIESISMHLKKLHEFDTDNSMSDIRQSLETADWQTAQTLIQQKLQEI